MKTTIAIALLVPCLASAAFARNNQARKATASLSSYNEVPAIATTGNGTFDGTINSTETQLTYTLTFKQLRGTVTQAHIHFAQPDVNGGIMIFLCSNLSNGPAGTATCPTLGSPLVVSGTLASGGVIGPTSQGIAAGDFTALVKAIKNGTAYVNVHSDQFPGGEIRGQIKYSGPKADQGEDLAP